MKNGQTASWPGGTEGKPKRLALIAYASGQLLAATSAVTSVQIGRLGMNTPTAMIHGPIDEIPSTGCSGESGNVVSIIETQNATATSRIMPSKSIVDGITSL